MSSVELLPDSERIARNISLAIGLRTVAEGPEILVNFKLKQVARRSGGLLCVPLFDGRGDTAVELGWMAVGVRMAIAIGGLLIQDPDVRRKAGQIRAEGLLVDAAQEMLNITVSTFNACLEETGLDCEVRTGNPVEITPDDVDNHMLQLGSQPTAGLYKLNFPGFDIPALTKRSGSLSVAFSQPEQEDQARPQIVRGLA